MFFLKFASQPCESRCRERLETILDELFQVLRNPASLYYVRFVEFVVAYFCGNNGNFG